MVGVLIAGSEQLFGCLADRETEQQQAWSPNGVMGRLVKMPAAGRRSTNGGKVSAPGLIPVMLKF